MTLFTSFLNPTPAMSCWRFPVSNPTLWSPHEQPKQPQP